LSKSALDEADHEKGVDEESTPALEQHKERPTCYCADGDNSKRNGSNFERTAQQQGS
jgi:hypothetical protein